MQKDMDSISQLSLAKWVTHKALNDFGYFLTWVKTYDESGGKDAIYYPADLDYLQLLADRIQGTKRPLWIPKSRRLLLTWTMCAYIVWKGMRDGSFHAFIQTNKEDDADFLVEWRVKYIWDNLPHWLKFVSMGGHPQAHYKFCKFTLPNGAKIWGVPQGPDVFRQYTPSLLFIDEAAKQDKFQETLTAVQPFYEKDFQGFYVSSVQPVVESKFSDVLYGPNARIRGEMENPMKGVREWSLRQGGDVLEIHYSADPHKDPERGGKEWYERAAREWVGGHDGVEWRQEMEIEPDARSGELVYPAYSDSLWDGENNGTLVEPFDPSLFEECWRLVDWGLRNETCCLWIGLLDDVYYVYREFYEKAPTVEYFKTRLAHWVRSESEPSYSATIIDPAADRKNHKGMRSTLHLLNSGSNSLRATKATNSDDGLGLVNEWLHQGRLKVFTTCTNTRWEFGKYRWQDWTEATQKDHNLKETPVDKFNHAMDCLKYFANFRYGWENRRAKIIEKDEYEEMMEKVFSEFENQDRYYSSGVR